MERILRSINSPQPINPIFPIITLNKPPSPTMRRNPLSNLLLHSLPISCIDLCIGFLDLLSFAFPGTEEIEETIGG